jgi:hypothetical protein
MSAVAFQAAEVAAPAPAHGRDSTGATRLAEWLHGGRLYISLAVVALVISAFSLLIPSTPSYDPWAWIIWGREIVHLNLQTTGGPSWKPLPVIFTTLFAPFGKAAPDLWLVIARTGALMAVAMTFKLALRLTRRTGAEPADAQRSTGLARAGELAPGFLAATIAALGLVSAGGFISDNALGYSEGLMAAVVLIAIDRHLDGQRRQAFAIAFAAALDRPEIWPFWGLYGLHLFWTDPEARKLVIGLFAAIPVFWFLPELWGSGHLFRGVNRAQNPRSNSPAFASCPFCAELKDHAWPLILLRIKAAAAFAVAVAGWGLWRARRGQAGGAPQRADAAVLSLAVLGIAWLVLIAIMTQAGFSGNNRYLVLGAALVCVVGGVGWGWAAQIGGELLARVTKPAVATVSAVTALVVVFMFIPSWIGATAVDLPAAHKSLSYQARLRSDLTRAVADAGGASKLLRCGTIMTEGFQVPMVAWTLGVHTLRIEGPPAGTPLPPAPNVIVQARATRHATLLPKIPRNASYVGVASTRTFKIFSTCR